MLGLIDYGLLHQSTVFYSDLGFKRVESPWLVTEAINNITAPPHVEMYYVTKGTKRKVFVASGEQSFLYLINKGFLPEGKYQTITPCMRNDDFDQWHTKYFMKNELIKFGDVEEKDVMIMVHDAMDFFGSLTGDKWDNLFIEKTADGYDVMYGNKDEKIEIGSYGMRECEFTRWIYGTGLAEPRFSRVKKYFEVKYGDNKSV